MAYVPAVVFAGGTVRHVATRLEDDFALDPAAVEAAITPRTKALFLGYPVQPDRGRPAGRRPGRARGDRRAPRPPRLQRRDLRPARLRLVPPPGVQRAAGDARPDDPHGRLLEGLRDDRLAGRLARGAGGDPRGDREGPPVRDHVGRRRRPRTRRSRRSSAARRTSSGCARSTTAGAGSSSTASTRSGLATFEPRGAFYAFPEVTSATGLSSEDVRPGPARGGARRGDPGLARSGRQRRGPRPGVLRDVATSSSRRPSAGSAGSWSAIAPALVSAR